MASLLPPEGTNADTSSAGSGAGSRVGLVVGLALALLAVMVAPVVVLTRSSDDTATQATRSPTPTATVTVTPTVEPSPTGTTEPQPPATGSGSLAAGLGPFTGGRTPGPAGTWITDVRTAGHDGYDRVVFEYTDVVPTYQVAYTSPPFVDTAGTTKPVAGAALLDVWLHGTSAVQLDAAQLIEHYPGPDRVSAGDTLVVTEIVDIDDFEANVHWTIGLTSPQPLTVTTLDAPGRLVIDITH